MFALRLLMEKFREGQKQVLFVFVDLRKQVITEKLRYRMTKSGVTEKRLGVVQDLENLM